MERLRLEVPETLPPARVDPPRLERVLVNLISNAIRYTPSGKVLVGCRRRKDGLVIAVHATGIADPLDGRTGTTRWPIDSN